MSTADEDLAQARAWCTVAELKLLESSQGPALETAGAADLRARIVRARTLRDKWRDLYTHQRRQVQAKQAARGNDRNRRSLEKSELFTRALARLEAQLAKVADAPTPPPAASTRARPTKSQRTLGHRDARARTRAELKPQRAALSTKPAVAPAPVAPASPAPATAAAPPSPAPAASAAPPAAKKSARSPKRAAPQPKTKAKKAATTLAPTSKTTKAAHDAVKRTRIKMSGKDTRFKGHVSARGKRAQASRDSKA
jgi:hypothetical protein